MRIRTAPKNGSNTHSAIFNALAFFRIFRWGSTYNVYSFLKVWVAYDGNFVEVMPAPSVKGSHCGVCGTFNRNKYDEFSGKAGNRIASSDMASEWQWKC